MDILQAANRCSMLGIGDLVLVAVSGGPDSVAMLHALTTASCNLGISLHIAHLNHGIRGEESNCDQVFVNNLAQHYGIPITSKRVEIPTIRIESGVGEEEAARIERHKFLRDTAANIGANKIAIGHNADDRAESVLLNIIRGSGIDGLASIKPVNDMIIRPLIDTSRQEIEHYIAEQNLQYCIDKTNLDTTYARNRVRHELIALLEENYNPEIRSALVRLAEIAGDQALFMRQAAESALNKVILEGGIDSQLLADMPKALQSQLIREKIREVKGDLTDISFDQIRRVIEHLKVGGDFTVNLPTGELFVTRKGNELRVRRREPVEIVETFETALAVPGKTFIRSIGISLTCEIVAYPIPQKLPGSEAMFDMNRIAGQLISRNVRPGDRIVPFGMRGSKKLQDIFVDKKISKRDRARAIVVCDDEKILWVVGVVTSELGKLTDASQKAIRIVAAPHQST